MAKRRREPDSDGATAEASEYNTVFVDTSFDTHLAMLISDSDTVLDFKKKLVLEHMQCFPEFGEIHINSLKVKRRANFYHLPDVMLVWSAFHGVKRNWFLSADVSGTSLCCVNPNSSEPGTSGGVKMDSRNANDNNRCLSSDVNLIQALPVSLTDGVTETNDVSEMISGFKDEKSLGMTTNFPRNNYLEENGMLTEHHAKKKRKMRHSEDVYENPGLGDGHALLHASGKDASIPKIVGGVKEGLEGTILDEQQRKPIAKVALEVSGMKNDHSNIEDMAAFEGTSIPATEENNNLGIIVYSRNLLGSNRKKEDTILESMVPENLIASKPESGLGRDVLNKDSGGVSVKRTDLSAKLMDANGAMVDADSGGNKRKKKKTQKRNANIQDTTDIEPSGKGESIKHHTETHKSEKKEGGKDSSLNHDHEVIKQSNSKASEHADPDFVQKEGSLLLHTLDENVVTEPELSSGNKKKKKRVKKSADTNLQTSGIEQTGNGVGHTLGLLSFSTNHIPEETEKEESIHKEKDVQINLFNISTEDACVKAQSADRNEADSVKLTQIKQTSEDVDARKKKMEKMTQSSAGSRRADFSAEDKDNQIVEFNQADKDGESTADEDKTAKKKRKKRNLTASDVHENLPVKDQKVGSEVLATEANLIISVDSEKTSRNVTSSGVLSRKSEEKLEEMHETVINTDYLAKTPDVQVNLLDASTEDACVKAQSANQNEADFVKLTQIKQISEDVDTRKKKMEKKTQSSAGNRRADFSAEEKDNQIIDFNQADKDGENTADKDKTSKKKRKKRNLTASDVHENLPVKDQKVGREVLATEANLIISVDSEKTSRNVTSSGVLSRKSEEKLEEMHETVVNTDDLVKTPDVQVNLLDASTVDASEKTHTPNRNEADYVKLTQTKQNSEDVDTRKTEIEKKTQNSVGNYRADFSAEEKENQIVGFNQADKDGEKTANKDKTTKKKRKERNLTASDVQGNLPVKDQKVGSEVLATEANLISSVTSEKEGRNVASAQIMSRKSEEKLEEMHETVVNTVGLAKTPDVQSNLLDASIVDGSEKTPSANRNEADIVKLAQTKQNPEDVDTRKRGMDKKTQTSGANYQAGFSAKEKENQIVEFNQADKDGENTENKGKTAKKKRKKRNLTASDVPENLLVKDQKVGSEVLATEANLVSSINSEQEGRNVASSQVMSRKSEEKLEEMHETVINSDDLAKTPDNEGKGINFKEYFVPGEHRDQVDSADKLKTSIKSNKEKKTGKQVKENGLPSVSISTELQNPVKASENQETEKKIRDRKDSSRRQGDSAQNSDWDEVTPKSFKRSSRVSANGMKDTNPGDVWETTLQKPNKNLAASSLPNQKNPYLGKSNSESSRIFTEKRGNKRSQSGLNLINKMATKTPEKKNLLTKSGALFQDISGESSSDENGTVHLDASICSPSDSSSMSGYSEGENELSQDSTRNGSIDAKGRSAGGKSMSKLDLSATKDMSMDMILRSSKRFKKAKIQASQDELDDGQQIEFVPESQLV